MVHMAEAAISLTVVPSKPCSQKSSSAESNNLSRTPLSVLPFDCLSCELEFEKKDCDELEDSQILAVEEKLGIIKSLGLEPNKEVNSFD